MTETEMAQEIANGLIETGIEGSFDDVSCSTAGDYLSIGVSQWEGARAVDLLFRLMDGPYYANRSYSSIEESGELERLGKLLGSPEGQAAQRAKLAEDCSSYVNYLAEFIENPRCIIYAGMWCPTSHYVVRRFLKNRTWCADVNNLSEVYRIFRDEYATAADCEEYAQGYANRADTTFEYVSSLDLSQYGVPPYSEGE